MFSLFGRQAQATQNPATEVRVNIFEQRLTSWEAHFKVAQAFLERTIADGFSFQSPNAAFFRGYRPDGPDDYIAHSLPTLDRLDYEVTSDFYLKDCPSASELLEDYREVSDREVSAPEVSQKEEDNSGVYFFSHSKVAQQIVTAEVITHRIYHHSDDGLVNSLQRVWSDNARELFARDASDPLSDEVKCRIVDATKWLANIYSAQMGELCKSYLSLCVEIETRISKEKAAHGPQIIARFNEVTDAIVKGWIEPVPSLSFGDIEVAMTGVGLDNKINFRALHEELCLKTREAKLDFYSPLGKIYENVAHDAKESISRAEYDELAADYDEILEEFQRIQAQNSELAARLGQAQGTIDDVVFMGEIGRIFRSKARRNR